VTKFVYVPAPTLRSRVLHFEVPEGVDPEATDTSFAAVGKNAYFYAYKRGKDWFCDQSTAVDAANKLTRKRIASLEKQLAELKAIMGDAT
jgi:hypothetical protein